MEKKPVGKPPVVVDQSILTASVALIDELRERVDNVALAVENLLEAYGKERGRLVAEYDLLIKQPYWHGGLYFVLVQRRLTQTEWYSYDIVWRYGKVVHNDPTYGFHLEDRKTMTKSVHRCDQKSGEYSSHNLRAALGGKEKFEYQLARQYESVLRPLRAELRKISALQMTLQSFGPPPSVADLHRALPELTVDSADLATG